MVVAECLLDSLMIKWQGLFFTNLSGDKTAKKTIKKVMILTKKFLVTDLL